MIADRQHAHTLIDQIAADQMTAAVRFLEFLMLDPVILDPAVRALQIAPSH